MYEYLIRDQSSIELRFTLYRLVGLIHDIGAHFELGALREPITNCVKVYLINLTTLLLGGLRALRRGTTCRPCGIGEPGLGSGDPPMCPTRLLSLDIPMTATTIPPLRGLVVLVTPPLSIGMAN